MSAARGPASGEMDAVAIRARDMPDALAVVGRETWTWREWNDRVARAARGLSALGADRVALRSADRLGLAVLALGALRAGLTGVLVPTRWPGPLATDALADAGVMHAVSDRPLAGIETITPEALSGETGGADSMGEGAIAVFTSGSTGAPKAAVVSHGALRVSARGVVAWAGLRTGDRWLLDLPVAHVGGLGVVLRCAEAGATLAVPDPGEWTADAIARLRPTHASLVSTQLRRLLASGADLSSLRAILLGGSAMPDDLLAEAVARGLPVSPSYGLTEMGSTVTAVSLPADLDALATSGSPLAGRKIRVREGQIEVGGATLFYGFLREGTVVSAAGLDGWYATGDLGRIDARGRLVVSGRAGLRFVSGGENVQPEAIERALLALDGVAEALVVPVPSAEYGQRPIAWVRSASGDVPDGDAIRSALREVLPGFMVPDAVLAWTGAEGMKPDRQRLTREAERWASRGSPDGGSARG